MKTKNNCGALRASLVAVQGALVAMAFAGTAHAADDAADAELAALTKPVNTVELGVGYVGQDSYKAGEYDGLRNKGPYLIGNFDLRGGAAYDSNDATRWRLGATNLGLDTRNIYGEYGVQGTYRITLGYDELYRARSDRFYTPYTGVGSNNLTLSSNWPIPVLAPSVTNGLAQNGQVGDAKNLSAAELADFRNVDLSTDRKKTNLGLAFNSGTRWEFKVNAIEEDKSGLKATGAVMTLSTSAGYSGGDKSVILPESIQFKTYQIDASASYTGESGYFKAAFYTSMFRNANKSMTFADPFQGATAVTGYPAALAAGRLGTAPDNDFHQLSVNGGYNLAQNLKFSGMASWGRSAQDQSFLPTDILNTVAWAAPRQSLGGNVDITTLAGKLNYKPVRDLNVALAYKYDEHHNTTPVSVYNMPADGDTGGTDNRENTPYSKKLQQFDLDGDYQLARGKFLKAGLERQEINRWCEGTWYQCSDTAKTAENTFKLELHGGIVKGLSGRLGFAHSSRTASDYNPDANILASIAPSAALTTLVNQVASTGYTFWGPYSAAGATAFNVPSTGLTAAQLAAAALGAAGNMGVFGLSPGYVFPSTPAGNTSYFLSNGMVAKSATLGGIAPFIPGGMERFNLADRSRNKVRSSFNYVASDSLSLQLGVDYAKDRYSNTSYGLQNATTTGYNLDATLVPRDDATIDLFVTRETQKTTSTGDAASGPSFPSSVANYNLQGASALTNGVCYSTILAKNLNAKVDPCLHWGADIRDTNNTVGAALKVKNLGKARAELAGSVLYSRARTAQAFSGGAYATQIGTGLSANNAVTYYAGLPTPDVTTDTWTLNINSKHPIDKMSWLRLSYRFDHMKSSDYSYAGYAYQAMVNVLPTFEAAPTFSVSSFGISYIHDFY
jgi:MtrB/PioB family decaheme-associated outer membrane protein